MPGRSVLFWCLSAVLVASAVFVLSGGAGGSTDPSSTVVASAPTARIYDPGGSATRVAVAPADLRPPARRFVAAFMRYEVGGRSGAVLRALRRSSTPSFFSQLVEAPTGLPPGGPRRAAAIRSLSLRALPGRPPVALVSGAARRADGAEQFSFLFVKTRAGWRARGPGE